MDRYTFQYAELRRGNAAALALAAVATEFVHSFSAKKHYDELLNAIVQRLSESEDSHVEEAWRALSASLSECQHSLLEEERKREKRPKKLWGAVKPVKDIINESSDDEEPTGFTPEELAEREQQRLAAEKAAEAEWERIQQKADALAQQKAANEALLAAKARKVDAKAFEEKLRQDGVVLLNGGDVKGKKGGGGKGGKDQALSPEEVGRLHQEVAETMREKETLKSVLATTDEELPAKITEAKAELAKAEAAAKAAGDMTNKKAKEMAKGQIVQLQQKLSKQTIEKNRLALQIKALEPNAQRDELVELLTKVDKIMVAIELAQA